MKVFLSHKSNQKEFVKIVANNFPLWMTYWIDENDILTGDDLNKTVKKAIEEECDFLIVFISDLAVQSDWVQKEVIWAREKEWEIEDVFVLPVLVECSTELLKDLGLENQLAIICERFDNAEAPELAKRLSDQVLQHCVRAFSENRENRSKKWKKNLLFAAYIALLVAGAAGGNKIIPLTSYFAAGVTVISFAFTFFISDCINQIYGQKEAKGLIAPGFFALLLATGFMYLFVWIPPVDWYEHQREYRLILTPPLRMFISGLIAYVIGQFCNVWIFDKIRDRTTFKQRGWRSILATLGSQFIDTLIFVPLAFLGEYNGDQLMSILGGQFIVKVFVAFTFSYGAFMLITKNAKFRPAIG